MPGSFGHLAARFFDYLLARPLDDSERVWVSDRLEESEAELFFAQSDRDQAHGHHAGRVVAAAIPDQPVAIRAALLHDVGKRHSRLGVVGRVVASLLQKLRLPMTKRMALYRDHPDIGAAELLEAGSPGPVVEFARHHHGKRPPGIDATTWEVLQLSDRPAKPGLVTRRR